LKSSEAREKNYKNHGVTVETEIISHFNFPEQREVCGYGRNERVTTTDHERVACIRHGRASSTGGSKGVERVGWLAAYLLASDLTEAPWCARVVTGARLPLAQVDHAHASARPTGDPLSFSSNPPLTESNGGAHPRDADHGEYEW